MLAKTARIELAFSDLEADVLPLHHVNKKSGGQTAQFLFTVKFVHQGFTKEELHLGKAKINLQLYAIPLEHILVGDELHMSLHQT
jgi:hypothetical protein